MRFLTLLAIVAAGAWAQQPRMGVCQIATKQDATDVLGPMVVSQERPGGCIWGVPGKKLALVVIVDSGPEVAEQIKIPRQAVPKNGGTVLEEPGVAPGAFSTRLRGAQAIFFLKGKTAVSVAVTNDDSGVLPIMLDKLRPVAKRIAGRI